MRSSGLEPRVVQGSYSRDADAAIALELLSQPDRPTAVFAYNDQAALGVLDAAIQLGLEPGKDLAVVGYDNSSLSKSPTAALTTVDVHGFELGQAAARIALERLANPKMKPRVEHHAPSLVIRSSSGSALGH